MFDGEKHALDIHRLLPPPVGERHIDKRHSDSDTSVSHHDVDATELPFNRTYDLRPTPFVCDVLMQIDGLPASPTDFRHKGLPVGVVQVGHSYFCALARQRACACRPDSAGPARHNGDPVMHLAHSRPLPDTSAIRLDGDFDAFTIRTLKAIVSPPTFKLPSRAAVIPKQA
jgi:hypothetical protein